MSRMTFELHTLHCNAIIASDKSKFRRSVATRSASALILNLKIAHFKSGHKYEDDEGKVRD